MKRQYARSLARNAAASLAGQATESQEQKDAAARAAQLASGPSFE